jgi:hypothetical protein
MKWLLALLILVGLSVAGCKSQAPVCDPFFGRATIPPPPTGSVTGRPADPCYQPPPLVQTPSQSPQGASPPTVQMPSQPSLQPQSGQPPVVAQPLTSQPTMPPAAPNQPASPPGLTPSFSAPRPSSTAPGNISPARPSSTAPAPGTNNLYAPPGGSFDYRGSSTRTGSVPLATTQPNSRASSALVTNVAASRTAVAGDDRMPGPVDDSAADGSIAGRKPIIRTIQPRTSNEASNRPVDILDLPKTPAGEP